jgi:hypothetical protein
MRKVLNVQFIWLIGCFVIVSVLFPFLTKPVEAQWRTDAKAEEQNLSYFKRYYAESRKTVYRTGELIKETSLYRLHKYFHTTSQPYDERPYIKPWCMDYEGGAIVALVFKVDENYRIENSESYWKLFENEMLPLIKSQCGSAKDIFIVNYVDGVLIDRMNRTIRGKIKPDTYADGTDRLSDGFSIGVYSIDPPDDLKYYWAYGWGTDSDLFDLIRMKKYLRDMKRNRMDVIAIKKLSKEKNTVRANGKPARNYMFDDEAGDSTLTSISRLREIWKDNIAKTRAEEAALEAEEKRQAELRKQRQLELTKAKGAPVFKYYKKGVPGKYSFSGYNQQTALESIYAGDFEPFTGGNDKDSLKVSNVLQMILPGGSVNQARQEMERVKTVARLRIPLRIAYFTYHQVFEEECASNLEMPWSAASFRTDTVKFRGFLEVGRIKGQTYIYKVRTPFVEMFMDTYDTVHRGAFAQYITGVDFNTKSEFETDFRKFLRAEKCASPAVRHFETNLFLATEWLLPLQSLPGFGRQGSQKPEIEKMKPQTEKPKPKPPVRKTGLKS